MNNITIDCKDIKKSFGQGNTRVDVLRGITFVARESEMIMLVGPSGAGKTTLISIVGGILQQDHGECLVLGTSIKDLSESEKIKFRGKNIGFLFQNVNLVPTLTSIENAAIPLILNGYTGYEAFEKASNLLKTIGLDQQRYHIPEELSGGEKQRVAIARAFIHKPKIILCDEPTSFLDHERGKQIIQLLRDIQKENNATLIIVTHDQRILGFADRILKIDDGLLVDDVTSVDDIKSFE